MHAPFQFSLICTSRAQWGYTTAAVQGYSRGSSQP